MATPDSEALPDLLKRVRTCRICEAVLPLGPRPVLRADARCRILIVGQAPGTRVHQTGVPWNDPSGDQLRQWTGLDRDTFYDGRKIAIIPMGFCYPGKGKSGDLPPRKECAETWHRSLLAKLPRLELTLLVGQYAQAYDRGTVLEMTGTVNHPPGKDYSHRQPVPFQTLWADPYPSMC